MEPERRHIPLAGSSNLRDVGGYVANDGRQVRWNVLFRSGALSRLTPSDWKWVKDRGIKAVCDLRSDEERLLAPTHWQGADATRHIGPAYAADIIFGPLARAHGPANVGEMGESLHVILPRILAPSFRMMFDALLAEHIPLIVHCSAGQDRTGLAVGLLLAALDVPHSTIFEDYLLSTALRRIENELDVPTLRALAETNSVARYYSGLLDLRGSKALHPRSLLNERGAPVLQDAFDAITNEWGSINSYLEHEVGISDTAIMHLRNTILEPA